MSHEFTLSHVMSDLSTRIGLPLPAAPAGRRVSPNLEGLVARSTNPAISYPSPARSHKEGDMGIAIQ